MQGGTESITATLAKGLKGRGHNVFSAYLIPCDSPIEDLWEADIRISKSMDLPDFLEGHRISAVICNLVRIEFKRLLIPALKNFCREQGCPLIICYHAMPGEELTGNSIRNCMYRIFHMPECAGISLKQLGLRIIPKGVVSTLCKKYIHSRYTIMHDPADALVLLSEAYFKEFAQLAGQSVDNKYYAIGNALTLDTFATEEDIAAKENMVLMLSRMDEKSKRISHALKIWKNVEKVRQDWKLVIVGGGDDLQYFKRMAKRLGLKNVSFEGRQPDAVSYYKRAKAFMLTSRYEGWGLTLTEAQQMGAVPFAYHSYAALPEIIRSGSNGFIVPNNDRAAFTKALLDFMALAPDDAQKIALQAVSDCHIHGLEQYLDKWENLLNKLS